MSSGEFKPVEVIEVEDDVGKNPVETKIKILEDELKITEDINLKFKQENENLKTNINNLNNEIMILEIHLLLQVVGLI